MIKDFISIGDKINLITIWNKQRENKPRKLYVSQVLDFDGDYKVKIAMPIEKGKLIPLEVGTKYEVCFYTKKGLYSCKAIVIERYRDENLFVLMIQLLSDLKKYQRRQYYRLDCMIDFRFHLISEEEMIYRKQLKNNIFVSEEEKIDCITALEELEVDWIEGIIIDISGGGIRFNSELKTEKGNSILLEFVLSSEEECNFYELEAQVVFSEQIKNKNNLYETRTEFKEISNVEREEIIRFIFEEDRKHRKREKGI